MIVADGPSGFVVVEGDLYRVDVWGTEIHTSRIDSEDLAGDLKEVL